MPVRPVIRAGFDYLKNSSQIKVTAYVIMPNHVHVILFFPTDNYNLNTIISNAKRFLAYQIVKPLKQLNENYILQQLETGLSEREKKKGKRKRKKFQLGQKNNFFSSD